MLVLVVAVGGLLTTASALASPPAPAFPRPHIDLFEGLSTHNLSDAIPGVNLAMGPHSTGTAISFEGTDRKFLLPQSVFSKVVDLLSSSPEFTLTLSLQQREGNVGSIFSLSNGSNSYLELQSSGYKNEVRLHYTHGGRTFVESFQVHLADGVWHRLALWVSGAQVELLVDCKHHFKRVLHASPDRNFTNVSSQQSDSEFGDQLALWLGQRYVKHSLFMGILQDVRVVAGPHGYLSQCPKVDSVCPTCGQFQLLQATVEDLTARVNQLVQKLEATEARIRVVEECDCQKSCRVNGSVHSDGATWQRDCDLCSCVKGVVQCRPVQCPETKCKNPVIAPGDCCPSCLKQCYFKGVFYDHGEQVNNEKQCVECKCENGVLRCTRIDPRTMCPELQCPPEQQFSVPDKCCKYCPGTDYCAKGHVCHPNATCLNLQTEYSCQCNAGFHGNGRVCKDVDECREIGGRLGHYCGLNTICRNSQGSYKCECLPGYKRVDAFNCREHNECSSGDHKCHPHATCINTEGSYSCHCNPGYAGDGFVCHPVCNETCQNGGVCVAPNACSCRRGFTGPSCERDLDECALGIAQCHEAATCVNQPGWYYCTCKPGYRSASSSNGPVCIDEDECASEKATCHSTAKCMNTDGSYQCSCEGRGPECSLSCIFNGVEVADGGQVTSKCEKCKCEAGQIVCHRPKCDCFDPKVNHDCCPECDLATQCQHQELHNVYFRAGEQWLYKCQTCECLRGESGAQIDCWKMDCPPVQCEHPVVTSDDCCPRCEDDPCTLYEGNSSSPGQPCPYAGHYVVSGSEWRIAGDNCTSCRCKVPYCDRLDGRLCCSYGNQCVGTANLVDDGLEQQQQQQRPEPPPAVSQQPPAPQALADPSGRGPANPPSAPPPLPLPLGSR
ncbi:protein kinase C-binding protein NELL1-like isoform X3 [Cloeon dipterum]|uniref:protein kinase C-binding protein NELL1-like isoform X3 n=1 Tax=Cloeon dipterum TaxID=197152 RepID=UPI0032209D66